MSIESVYSCQLKSEEKVQAEAQREKFEASYEVLINLQARDIRKLQVVNGELQLRAKSPWWVSQKKANEVLLLVQQTYRQTWGKVIDAQYGFGTLPEAVLKVDRLIHQLTNVFPQALLHTEPEKHLSILNEGYRNNSICKEVINKRAENEEKNLKSHSLDKNMQGLTEATIIKAQEIPIAIEKSLNEVRWGEAIALEEGYEQEYGKRFSSFSGFNESLASHLNVLLSGNLGIPLVVKRLNSTQHAYAQHNEKLHERLDRCQGDKSALVQSYAQLDIKASQRFVFAQLITRNADCHTGNILISPNNEPIPIDFGRILSGFLPLRASYLNFPCLDIPINSQDREFYKNLDIAGIIGKLEQSLKKEYPNQFTDPFILKVINRQLNLLKGRLIMVQIGIKMGLNQRQFIALDLPKLPSNLLDKCANDKELRNKITRNRHSCGFQAAWNAANSNGFDETVFKQKIVEEIKRIQQVNSKELYGNNEVKAYQFMQYVA